MRISDWSSDVCSSDLAHVTNDIARGLSTPLNHAERLKTLYGSCMASAADEREIIDVPPIGEDPLTNPRSEEHTSELQSLMRSSYAVFCLKTKKTLTYSATHTTTQRQPENTFYN